MAHPEKQQESSRDSPQPGAVGVTPRGMYDCSSRRHSTSEKKGSGALKHAPIQDLDPECQIATCSVDAATRLATFADCECDAVVKNSTT
jgi:hypothetical protein